MLVWYCITCVNAQLPLDTEEGNEGSDEDAAAAAAADDDDNNGNDMDGADAFIDLRIQQGAVQLRKNLAHGSNG